MVGDGFEGADGCGADGNDSARAFFCGVDCAGVFFVDGELFAVDFVVFEGSGFYGAKRSRADVEGDVCEGYVPGFEAADKPVGEVEACGRGGDGAGVSGVNGLVAELVGGGNGWVVGTLYVRGQGREADLGQDGFEGCFGFQADGAFALEGLFEDFGGAEVAFCFVGEVDCFAGLYLAGAFYHYPPGVRADFGEQQSLESGACWFSGEETGLEDPGVVEDEAIAGAKEIADFVESAVGEAGG